MITALRRRITRFRKDEAGTNTIEFCFYFPVFFMVLVSAIEAGVLNLRHVMIERGLDIAVRAVRLNTGTPPTHDDMKRMICNVAGVLPNCMDVLQLELVTVNTSTWTPLLPDADCIDRNSQIDPVISFTPGQANDMMLVRACAVFDPIVPGMGLGFLMPVDGSGAYRLIATSAFVNEPT